MELILSLFILFIPIYAFLWYLYLQMKKIESAISGSADLKTVIHYIAMECLRNGQFSKSALSYTSADNVVNSILGFVDKVFK